MTAAAQVPALPAAGAQRFTALLKFWFPPPVAQYRRLAIGTRPFHVVSGTRDGDAGYYDCRVVEPCVLRESIGDGVRPTVILPDLTFEIARDYAGRDAVGDLLTLINTMADQKRAYRPIEVWLHVPERPHLDDESLLFHGMMWEDGVEVTPDRIRVRAVSDLSQFDVAVPNQMFELERDEHYRYIADPSLEAQQMPVLYGAWTDRGSYYALPAAVVDRRVAEEDGSHAMRCLLCDPGADGVIGGIGEVAHWQSAGGEPRGRAEWHGKFTVEEELRGGRSSGFFRLLGSHGTRAPERNVWDNGDQALPITARGNLRPGAWDLIEQPAAIIKDLLQRYGGVPAAQLGASFDAVVTPFRFRGFLQKPRRLITEIIAELCGDAGLVLHVVGDRFEVEPCHLLQWEPAQPTGVATLTALHTLDSQRHMIDPPGWRYEGVEFCYRYNPRRGEFTRRVRCGSQMSDAKLLHLESQWVWRELDALEIAQRCFAALSGHHRLLELNLPAGGLRCSVNQTVRWSGEGLRDRPFHVFECARNFADGGARLRLIQRALSFDGAIWSKSPVPAWDESLPSAVKERYGWWVQRGPSEPEECYSNWRTNP